MDERFQVGASTMTLCCSILPGLSKLHSSPGSRIAVHFGLSRPSRFDRRRQPGWRERPRGPNGATGLGTPRCHLTLAMAKCPLAPREACVERH